MADCKDNKEEKRETNTRNNMEFDSPEGSNDSVNDDGEKGNLDKDSENSSSSNSTPNPAPKSLTSNIVKTNSNESKNKDNLYSKSFLSASKFGSNFGVNPSDSCSTSMKLKSSLLRPSALSSVTNSAGSTTKSILQPPKLQNPFAKLKDEEEEEQSKDEKEPSKSNEAEEEEKEDIEKKRTFLALGKSPTKESEHGTNSAMAATPSTPGFVFGQNLKERVAVARDADSSDSSDKEEVKEEVANENGASELMFSNAAAICKASNNDKPDKTLTEAAQELEAANRANKRKYDEVTLLTGEEDETNVLQINCKLFAFDKTTSSYQERGRGSLRLNDRDEESRLVARAAGTQRLVLNTKVWPGMTAERAGPKSLRLTAMDVHGEVRIFVVQAAQKEVEQLHSMLMSRLKRAQERQPKKLATEH